MNIIRPMLSGNIEITGQAPGPGVHAGKKPRVTAAFAMGAAVFFGVEYETWWAWLNPGTPEHPPAPTW